MKHMIRAGFVVLAMFLAVGAHAQDSGTSTGDQFRNGAQQIGEGASNIGQGIKQGAIQTWEAVKAGAQAASDKFNGRTPEPPRSPAPITHEETN